MLSSFVLLGLWVLGADLYEVVARRGSWTGTDGVFMPDQLQYLAWIRDASQHFLASNMFVLRPAPHDYFQPMIAISAGLVALGMAPWLALLLWKPVGLAVVLIGIRRFVHRTVTGVGARRAALVVALFAGTNRMFIDLWLPMWTWGYPFALVALGAALLSALSYEQARAQERLPLTAATLAALAAWLHPWQGEVLILSLVGAEAVMWALGRRPRLRSLVLMAGAVALPLAYYAALHHFDASWRLAAESDDSGLPLLHIASWLWPLAIPALLAYRLRPRHLSDAVVRVWPFAVLACYLVNLHGVGNSPVHAFLGITVPLAILAAQGLKSITWPTGVPRVAVAAVAVAAITLPGTIQKLTATSRSILPGPHQENFMPEGEADALQYVAEQPGRGGVLTGSHLGVAVPAETGRRTYIGDKYWSQPDFWQKQQLVVYLLLGRMGPHQARAFVLSTGARFLIKPCWAHTNLTRVLRPIIQTSHRFDCARVYMIKQKPRSGHPTLV